MATLVLTVVGGIVGGPVGAALGAAIGQQADAAIFRPKGREGPRLADLKVQASTYGQQIPKLFGTMRVAGSVIWATDLIERRTKRGGGKGRPSTTEYSYSVSLAVALSSRPIRAIRRIWADGNLLRGAGGSFRERCTFRWHDGSEDQPADPLVASAVGIGSASAFRGLAYAVFEELELAGFGNRIPSLTFEVEADDAAVDGGFVGDVLLGEAGRCVGNWPIAGYAASGERAREALAPLFAVDGVRLASGPAGWRLAPAAASEPSMLSDFAEMRRAVRDADRVEQRRAPLSSLPGLVNLRYYEPARDYQLGQQSAEVAGGGVREELVDLPAALPAESAYALAHALARAAADDRETCIWRADLAALALPIGGPVVLPDGSAWRSVSRTVRGGEVMLELCRHQPLPVTAIDADGGQAVTPPDWPDGETVVHLFDCPNIGTSPASAPRLLVAAAGSNAGWRGADIWICPAPDAEPIALGMVRPAAALGALAGAVPASGGALIDLANDLVVTLVNPSMMLESVENSALLGGANRAMLGTEMLQFGTAERIGAAEWRLSRLLRGRGGSEIASHPAGTPFVLLDDIALLPVPDPVAQLVESGSAMLQWAGRASTAVAEAPLPAVGQALAPLPPVHGRVRPDGAGGFAVEWMRCSRFDTGWRDHVDLPLGESREAWEIAPVPPVPGAGPWTTTAQALHLDAAAVASLPVAAVLAVRQVGDLGRSRPLFLTLN